MKIALAFTFFLIGRLLLEVKSLSPFVFTSLSAECYNINTKFVEVIKCNVDVKNKGKTRLLNIETRFKQPISDFYAHVRFFQKMRNGKFVPHIINLDLDACKAADVFDSKNPIIGRIGSFFERFIPELRHGCPFKGTLNISEFDLTKEGAEYFPPTVAPGIFMLQMRVHTGKANRTLSESKYIFEIKMAKGMGLF